MIAPRNPTLTFAELSPLLGGREVVDAVCPACSAYRKPPNRKLKVLRIWRIDEGLLSYNCAHCEEHGYARENSRRHVVPRLPREREIRQRDAARESDQMRIEWARALWRESIAIGDDWAADYITDRGLALPKDREIRDRTLRIHPNCPFPDKTKHPALLAAFTLIWSKVAHDPFFDPAPVAIHRIRGRGHDNKAMLGPVKGCAVMISPWWHVWDTLHVCEGVETALALWNEGAAEPDDCHRPVWALGSAGAIADLPVILRVRHLVIWADHDRNGTSLKNAHQCADRWSKAGRRVVIRYPGIEGKDYAD